MSTSLVLPKETEPEKTEVKYIERKETQYVALNNDKSIETTDHAHAYAIKQLISPDTKEAQLSLTKESRRAIILGNGLIHVVEDRINMLRNCSELERPIYPKFTLFSDLKKAFDLQSNGDGTTRAQMTQILSVPQMGFGFPQQGNSPFLENIRRNYMPETSLGFDANPKPKKKHFWSRGSD